MAASTGPTPTPTPTPTPEQEIPLYLKIKAIKYVLNYLVTKDRTTTSYVLREVGVGRVPGDSDEVQALVEKVYAAIDVEAVTTTEVPSGYEVHVWISAFKNIIMNIGLPEHYFTMAICTKFHDKLVAYQADDLTPLVEDFQSMFQGVIYGCGAEPDAVDPGVLEVILCFEAIYYIFALAQHISCLEEHNRMGIEQICTSMVGPN